MAIDLDKYHAEGIKQLLQDAMKATVKAPRLGIFITRFAQACKRAEKLRAHYTAEGRHIPPFIIASITSACNLHCAGCYARANHMCGDKASEGLLTAAEWDDIFNQAESIGICFILLAGGEPMLRTDVLRVAAEHKSTLFPIFTNGTLLKDDQLDLFDKNRNLVPIISIEGDAGRTDARRGSGVYETLEATMKRLSEKSILFGASITVTTQNAGYVTSDAFLETLRESGCKVVIYVEYVPADGKTHELAPTDKERDMLCARMAQLREAMSEIVFIAFPGDEFASGGCLAAGRGFFHINPYGGAEPCPFSAYSDTNVRQSGVLGALDSPLFQKLRAQDILQGVHSGGCVLFEHDELVKQIAKR